MSAAKSTTDHEEIRRWAEERGGKPAVVRRTHGDGGGVIRLAFPNAPQSEDEALEEISWDEWFRQFDDSNLALLYQEKTSDGQKSNFNKIVGRDAVEARERGDHKAHR